MDGSMPLNNWINVCSLDDIPVRGSRRVNMFDTEIAIFRTQNDDVYAIENRCPHKQGPLSEGIVHDNGVTCPLHSWVIDFKTGQARGVDDGCVSTYEVELNSGRVFVKFE